MTEITLNLTLQELKTLDKYVELNDETRPLFDKIRNAYPKPETLLDVIRNLGYSYDCCYEIVDAVEEFEKSKEPEKEQQIKELVKESVKWCEEHPNESVEDWVKPREPDKEVEKFVEKKKESWMDKPVEELVAMLEKNPPEFLKFQLGKTLEQIVTRWWCDTFTGPNEKWSMEECIDDLIDQIQLWLPKSQSAAGSQSLGVEELVEGFNDCLNKIKSKLRNKKDT